MDTIPLGFIAVGIRLAVREEGGVIRAYLAHMDSMDGAIPVATLSLSVVHLDGGRNGPLFTAWLEALSAWMNRLASNITGLSPQTIQSFTLDAKPQG